MRKVLLFVVCFCILAGLQAAKRPKAICSIPFEMAGSYVVVRVKINDSSPLNLIMDSGIRNTLITELQPGDQISLNYSDVKDLMGLGEGNNLEAYSSNYNTLKIGKLKLESKLVYVLKEDIFNLSKHTGTKINGLIGIDFFKDYTIEVDYGSKRIKFYKPGTFSHPKGYEMLPLNIEAQKMFVELKVLEADSTYKNAKMLIDTGAELNAWFQSYKADAVHVPVRSIRGTIGQGLSGEITGKIARISRICFGSHCLPNPVVSFPDSACIAEIVGNSDRDGTVGSQIINRFNYAIDYEQKLFYFKPNRNFTNKFSYNVAGIEISQIIPFVPQTEVWKVWEGSPAEKAGVQVGDQVLEVNDKKSFEMSISEIKAIFQTPSKQPMKLKVFRNNTEVTMEVDMNSRI